MKKTWTTKILIALLTLAMVVGVVAIAPKEAQAKVTATTINGATSGSSTIGVGASQGITLNGGWSTTGTDVVKGDVKYNWTTNSSQITPSSATAQSPTFTATAAGSYTVTCTASDSDGAAPSATWTITVAPFAVTDVTGLEVGASAVAPSASNGTIKSLSIVGGGGEFVEIINKTSVSGKSAGTATITATSTEGATDDFTVTVVEGTQTITASASPSTGVASSNTKITLSANNNRSDGGTVTWEKSANAHGTLNENVYTAHADDATDTITFTATAAAVTDKYGVDTDTVDVRFTKQEPGLWVNASRNSASYGSSAITLTAGTSNNAGSVDSEFTWATSNASAGSLSGSTGKSITFTPAASGVVSNTTTITVSYTNANYENESKTLTITVSPNFEVNPTSLSLRANNTSTQSFTVVTAAGADVTASSSNNNIVTVEKTYTSSNSASHTFTVKPVGAGDAKITVSYAGTTKTVSVYVANANPVISQVDFVSCDWCTPNLTKVNNWGQLTITVKDYNPSNPYVTVTRSNIRTYVQGGSYYSHGSTYSYVAMLTPKNNGLDGQAVLYVIPQYNGTTYYTASYTGATSKNSPTIYVTGHTTLPQTGPNYIWAYVLGGLCLATVATAITLNVRKKKRENI